MGARAGRGANAGSLALWRDVPRRLAASTGHGVFAYSRFGYGNSDPTPLPRPMSYMHDEAKLLPAVLRAAGIEAMVLLGHSDGGSIAAIYAGSGPPAAPALLGVVTIAAHFIVEDLNIASIRRIKAKYDTGGLRRRLARYHRDVETAFRGWNDAWLDPRFRDFDITCLLPNIWVPILALQGSDDPYGSDEQLRVLETNARAPIIIQSVASAGHSPHLEAKHFTLTAITGFVANLPRDTST